MERLTNLNQIKLGTRLKLIGVSPKDSYGSVSVKRIIKCDNRTRSWNEILINRRKNYYFDFELYLEGKSWVKEAYVLEGFDKRISGVLYD